MQRVPAKPLAMKVHGLPMLILSVGLHPAKQNVAFISAIASITCRRSQADEAMLGRGPKTPAQGLKPYFGQKPCFGLPGGELSEEAPYHSSRAT